MSYSIFLFKTKTIFKLNFLIKIFKNTFQGLSESAVLLQKEASLPARLPSFKPVYSGFTTGNRGYVKMAGTSQRSHTYLMTMTPTIYSQVTVTAKTYFFPVTYV